MIGTVASYLADFKLEWETPLHKVDGHAGPQGTNTRLTVDRKVSISFAQRWATTAQDTIASDSHLWETRYEAGTALDLQLEVGDTLGRFFSVRCPSWIVMDQPALEDIDGIVYHRIKMVPNDYTGDTGSTAPANAQLSLGWG
jgi:hypothetical protein